MKCLACKKPISDDLHGGNRKYHPECFEKSRKVYLKNYWKKNKNKYRDKDKTDSVRLFCFPPLKARTC